MKDLLLGIDIGTSACKTALFTPDGKLFAHESAPYSVFSPAQGYAEQDADEWFSAVCTALRRMFSKHSGAAERIAAVAIDGQSWSAIPVSKDGAALSKTPIWYDTRAVGICERIKADIPEDELLALSGNPLKPSYSMPKILWFAENRPEIYDKTYKFMQSNSYIVLKLTGCFSQDRTQCYGYACYDMPNGKWNKKMMERLGIDPALLPEISECADIIGRVTKEASELTGIPYGVAVCAGALDAACGTLGAGAVATGTTQEQGGQAGGMSICTEKYTPDIRLILSDHIVPKKYLLQGGTVGGGGALRWFSEEICAEEQLKAAESGRSLFAILDDEAADIPAGSGGIIFLPYMAGERSPIWDEKAKGVFFGLDYGKRRAHMIRAVMESAAFSLRHNLETAAESGVEARELLAMGGAANSRLWTQIKADVTGKRILVPSSDTATTLGAAMIAGVGCGFYDSYEQAVKETVKITRVHEPNRAVKDVYDKNYEIYLKLYESLRPITDSL